MDIEADVNDEIKEVTKDVEELKQSTTTKRVNSSTSDASASSKKQSKK